MSVLVVLCTCPDEASAARIAHAVVQERLAACVNRLQGVRSTYWWKDSMHEDNEVLLVMKTAADRFEALSERVMALHPAELPELIAVKVAAGSAPYLRWILDEARSADGTDAIGDAPRRSP